MKAEGAAKNMGQLEILFQTHEKLDKKYCHKKQQR